MAVVYKRGIFLKPRNKKALILSVGLLVISIIALFIVHSINHQTISVQEHADTKLSPTIYEYSAKTDCQGQTFVIKYKLVIKTPAMKDTKQTVAVALQAFFPSVVQKDWVTYISSSGELLGNSAIKWAWDMHANETKELYYTLTVPGGKLQPGADFKNIAVLASSAGFKEQKTLSVIIDNCGAPVTNPVLPSVTPTPFHTPTPTPTETITNQQDNNDYTDSGESNGFLGQLYNQDEASTSDESLSDDNNQQSDSSGTFNQDNNSSNNEKESGGTGSGGTGSGETGSGANGNTAQPPAGAQLEAATINTGVLDSPVLAFILLGLGIMGRFLAPLFVKTHNPVICEEVK